MKERKKKGIHELQRQGIHFSRYRSTEKEDEVKENDEEEEGNKNTGRYIYYSRYTNTIVTPVKKIRKERKRKIQDDIDKKYIIRVYKTKGREPRDIMVKENGIPTPWRARH